MRLPIRIIVVCLVVAGLLPPGLAWATAKKVNPHATYALASARKCKIDFVKRTEKHTVVVKVKGKNVKQSQRYIACIYVAPKPVIPPAKTPTTPTTLPVVTPTSTPVAPAATPPAPITTPPIPSFTYKAHVDPSFVQSPANPKVVTYSVSAGATQSLNGQNTDLGQAGQLPSGILELFSDGNLACSINVGGATTGGPCVVPYSIYGVHAVVTHYILNGVAPVTETDPEDIEPFATSQSVSTPFLGSTVDINDWAYQVISIPVTVSGLTNALGSSGTVSLTNTDATNESCEALVFDLPQGSASTTCTADVENDPSVATSWTPTVTFSGDGNYSSSGATGPVVSIPAAPAPTIDNITSIVQCAESGGFCSEYDSNLETTGADANVYAGPIFEDVAANVGTVTFTSSDHLLICTATVFSALHIPSNNARCTGNGGPFSGPLTVQYSGGTVEQGDTVETVYSSASTVGGSN